MLLAAVAAATLAAACGSGSDGNTITVDVGYQSKTINTVTVGTLLRDRGTFEAKLAELGKAKGVHYRVIWKDFAAGPPLTAQMLAGQVDIGSMGDAPLLVNGSKTRDHPDVKSELISVTGYNMRGSLNQVVVPVDSPAARLADLRGQVVSTSKARLLYDGGSANIPTFHAVVANQQFDEKNPDVIKAFLAAQRDTTDYLNRHPLAAAERVAEITGLSPEVVYLYNGPNGLVSFDPTIKQQEVDALAKLLPFLKSLGAADDLDHGRFVDDKYVRAVYGADYDTRRADTSPPSPLTGTDPICGGAVDNPATASEV
jgi:NitT/TauT family transport system substrate-binding protein